MTTRRRIETPEPSAIKVRHNGSLNRDDFKNGIKMRGLLFSILRAKVSVEKYLQRQNTMAKC